VIPDTSCADYPRGYAAFDSDALAVCKCDANSILWKCEARECPSTPPAGSCTDWLPNMQCAYSDGGVPGCPECASANCGCDATTGIWQCE
jgi:hypothetical protein